ncbi:hypothetical protein BDZ97DRAFT_1923497 [Flammula alnicola]|nr:hypothetical protein BDZ97DRAFT_1923497 [Flammula alnicola]
MSFNRPLTRSISRSNQSSSHIPEFLNNSLTLPSAGSNNHLPPRTRPSRDFVRYPEEPRRENQNYRYSDGSAHYFRKATHKELMDAGNQAHADLYDGFNGLQARHDELRRLYDNLLKNSVKTDTNVGLSSSSSASPTPTAISSAKHPPKPKQDDYPGVKYWTRREYNQHLNSKKKAAGVVDPMQVKKRRGGARLSESNENTATDYIELEDGTIVDGDTAQSIRKLMRSIFIEMEKSRTMALPDTWSEAGVTERSYVLQELYSEYPYIRYCDDNWKAIFLASHTLSEYKAYKKRRAMNAAAAVVKAEKNDVKHEVAPPPQPFNPDDSTMADVNDIAVTTPTTSIAAKRKAADKLSNTAKRVRTSETPTLLPSSKSNTDSSSATPLPSSIHTTASTSASTSTSPDIDPSLNASPAPSPSSITSEVPHVDQTVVNTADTTPAASSSHSSPLPMAADSGSSTRPQPRPIRKSQAENAIQVQSCEPSSPQLEPKSVGSTTTPASVGSVEASQPLSLVNPFNALFGPATGFSTRIESLRATATAAKVSGKATIKSLAKDGGKGKKGDTQPAENSNLTFAPGMKRVTASAAPKNLCYIEYLETHDPITPASFESYWKAMNKEEIKKWTDLSKVKKEAGEGQNVE